MMIREIHQDFWQGGLYPVLRELKKRFWIDRYFSTVKKALKQCFICRRVDESAIKIDQNSYRDFRINPARRLFSPDLFGLY